MKRIYCFLIFLWPLLSNGQTNNSLSIWNTVPDIELHQLINYKDTSARLSDFKGKLVILDFWSTYCKTCIKGLPKLDSLQKEFDGKIQILLITHPAGSNFGPASIKETFAKWKKAGLYIPAIPVATSGNEAIISMFPHEYIPYYVWIDSKGRILALTSYLLMTKQTIRTLLNKD